MIFRKDSWIRNLSQTEDGKEFLKAIARLNQTEVDVDKLREFKEKGGM